ALLGGVDISALRLCVGTRHVGYLPQDIELFGGSMSAMQSPGERRKVMTVNIGRSANGLI
ncbi:hypothetical protein, partial [Rhizobium leguminosarum]|uniref:hypothetical protein n=1 Tax=Rhizobium leguminosarum TaxID=384 RepID=UPI003F9ABBFF